MEVKARKKKKKKKDRKLLLCRARNVYNKTHQSSIRMRIVIIVVVVNGCGRIIRVGVSVGVEGIGRREAEEGPEAESETTQLVQRKATDEI